MSGSTGAYALARGAIEAGVSLVTGYPGAPATAVVNRILELTSLGEVQVEWSSNEKVAIEMALGLHPDHSLLLHRLTARGEAAAGRARRCLSRLPAAGALPDPPAPVGVILPLRLNGRSIFALLCWHQGAVCGAEAFTPPNLLRRPK